METHFETLVLIPTGAKCSSSSDFGKGRQLFLNTVSIERDGSKTSVFSLAEVGLNLSKNRLKIAKGSQYRLKLTQHWLKVR